MIRASKTPQEIVYKFLVQTLEDVAVTLVLQNNHMHRLALINGNILVDGSIYLINKTES